MNRWSLQLLFFLLINSLARSTGGTKTFIAQWLAAKLERYPAWLAVPPYLKSRIKNASLFLPLEFPAITQSVRNTRGGISHITLTTHSTSLFSLCLCHSTSSLTCAHKETHTHTHVHTLLSLYTVKAAPNCLLLALIFAEQMAASLHHMASTQEMRGAL